MKQNEIKHGQLSLLLCIIIPAGKLLSMPYICFNQGGRDFWLGMTLSFFVDFVSFVFVLWGMSLNKNNQSFKEVLQNIIGKFFADIILLIFAICFFAKFLYVLLDVLTLYTNTFVLKSDWVVFACIALFAIWFIQSRGFKVIARLAQILFIPITICIIAISVLSLGDCNFEKLLPFAENGMQNVVKTSLSSYFMFGDSAIVMLLLGDTKKSKRNQWQILLGTGSASVISIFVCVIYVALFGELAGYGDIAVARISQFNFNTSVAGRLDWLLISGWILAIFLLLFTYAHCFLKSVDMVFDKKAQNLPLPPKKGFWIYVVFAVVVVLLPVLVDARGLIEEVFLFGFGRYVNIFVSVIVALLLPLLVFLSDKKTTDKNKSKIAGRISATVMEV